MKMMMMMMMMMMIMMMARGHERICDHLTVSQTILQSTWRIVCLESQSTSKYWTILVGMVSDQPGTDVSRASRMISKVDFWVLV
jgi:hypothetical protein